MSTLTCVGLLYIMYTIVSLLAINTYFNSPRYYSVWSFLIKVALQQIHTCTEEWGWEHVYLLNVECIFRLVLKHNQHKVKQMSVADKKTKLENSSKYSNPGSFSPGASLISPSYVKGWKSNIQQ